MSENAEVRKVVLKASGAGRLTHYALDEFFSQELSKFTECDLDDLAGKFPQSRTWLTNCMFNTMLGHPIPKEHKPFLFTFIRHAELALTEYELARQEIKGFLEADRKKVSKYFLGLGHLEFSIMRLYQAYELYLKKLRQASGDKSKHLFKDGDGSPLQRLNRIYNVIKHTELSSIAADHLHPIWLSKDGVAVSGAVLKYPELSGLVLETAEMADEWSRCDFSVTKKT